MLFSAAGDTGSSSFYQHCINLVRIGQQDSYFSANAACQCGGQCEDRRSRRLCGVSRAAATARRRHFDAPSAFPVSFNPLVPRRRRPFGGGVRQSLLLPAGPSAAAAVAKITANLFSGFPGAGSRAGSDSPSSHQQSDYSSGRFQAQSRGTISTLKSRVCTPRPTSLVLVLIQQVICASPRCSSRLCI